MKAKYNLTSYIQLLGILVSVVVLTGSCANIVPPSGGYRDSLPPRLVTALPKDSAINVTAKNITLTFDEFVTLENAIENIIYNPTLKTMPSTDHKLRNVTIRFRDSLEPNTTYSIDFGNAIQDVNENNIAKNFRYVFSTGSTIDYNSYSGKVIGRCTIFRVARTLAHLAGGDFCAAIFGSIRSGTFWSATPDTLGGTSCAACANWSRGT